MNVFQKCGHPKEGHNVYQRKDGGVRCRTCQNQKAKEYGARNHNRVRPYPEISGDNKPVAPYVPARLNTKVAKIVKCASDLTGYSVSDIKGLVRKKEICRIRDACCLLAREAQYSYPQAGREMGRRDHTTIISSVRNAEWLVSNDAGFAKFFYALRDEVTNRPDSKPNTYEYGECSDYRGYYVAMRRSSQRLLDAIMAA